MVEHSGTVDPPLPVAVATVEAGPPVPPAEPFDRGELLLALRRPHRALDVVLGEPRRLGASLGSARALPTLIVVLLAAAVAASVPFGALDGPRHGAHPAMLFLGSVLLCVPALHVFSAYLGLRLHPAQNLSIALVIPAAAALLTFGFAPIQWFLAATMPATGGAGGPVTRTVLLVVSMLLALSHLNRCLFADERLRSLRGGAVLWIGWQALLLFVSWRMAQTLGLWP